MPTTTSTAVATSISLGVPQINLNSSVVNGQTVVNISISNFSSNIYGYQIVLDNLGISSSKSLVNQITNWLPTVANNTSSVSLIAIDTSLNNPLPSSGSSLLASYSTSVPVNSPISLYGFSLTQIVPGAKPSEINLNNVSYNVNITGPLGFTLFDTASSHNYVGSSGLDTLILPNALKNYIYSSQQNTITLNSVSSGSVSTVQNFERFVFKDIAVAFDLNAAAGQVAKTLGAILGPSSVNNPLYAGIGLSFMNQGTYADLINLALTFKLGSKYSVADEINLLYKNLLNQNATTSDINSWAALISNGTYTQVSLAQFATDSAINASNINLSGLMSQGLLYAPQ